MSIRQPEEIKNAKVKMQNIDRLPIETSRTSVVFTSSFCIFNSAFLSLDIGHLVWVQALQKAHRLVVIELGVVSFDDQKEAVACRQRKARIVEDRMIRLRQLVQGEHAEDSRKGGGQDSAFKSNRNK